MYDVWSDSVTYFIATFAPYPSNTVLWYDCHLHCFPRLEDEDDHSAKEHERLLRFDLGLFGKEFSNVEAIIGYYCATNRLLSKNVKVLFLGCASHRINIAVKEIIKENASAFDNVKCIMSQLCFLVRGAKICK